MCFVPSFTSLQNDIVILDRKYRISYPDEPGRRMEVGRRVSDKVCLARSLK